MARGNEAVAAVDTEVSPMVVSFYQEPHDTLDLVIHAVREVELELRQHGQRGHPAFCAAVLEEARRNGVDMLPRIWDLVHRARCLEVLWQHRTLVLVLREILHEQFVVSERRRRFHERISRVGTFGYLVMLALAFPPVCFHDQGNHLPTVVMLAATGVLWVFFRRRCLRDEEIHATRRDITLQRFFSLSGYPPYSPLRDQHFDVIKADLLASVDSFVLPAERR